MARKKESTPAQAQRNKLTEAIRDRGERPYNIWLVRPPFESRDLILNSDPQFETFYFLEGEPTFAEIYYRTQWYKEDAGSCASEPSSEFAMVKTLEGVERRVHLAIGTEEEAGALGTLLAHTDGSILITMSVLNDHIQRIENWRRVIPCIRRTRLHATAGIERQIAMLLHTQGHKTLRDLQARFVGLDAAIFYGAVALLLRRREILSDLDSRPWSLNTVVWTEGQ